MTNHQSFGYRQLQGEQSRAGLTVLELLIVMSILALLFALLLPGVQSVRESSRRIQCQNHLRQIGLALHLHHDTHQVLPAGWKELPASPAAFGWIPELLPFLEQAALQDRVKLHWPGVLTETGTVSDGRWVAVPGQAAEQILTPPLLYCPSDAADDSFRLFSEEEADDEHDPDALSEVVLMELPHSNYVGVNGVSDPDRPNSPEGEGTLIHRRQLRFSDLSRGLSQVAVVSERTARRLPSTWLGFHLAGEDAAGRVVGYAWLGPNHPQSDECEFDSRHPGCIQMLFADGHVQVVSDGISTEVYRQMARRSE